MLVDLLVQGYTQLLIDILLKFFEKTKTVRACQHPYLKLKLKLREAKMSQVSRRFILIPNFLVPQIFAYYYSLKY